MKLVDRTRALSETVGLADFELGGTPTGYQSFSTALNDGDVTFYTIVNTTTAGEWEVGKCTYNNGVISRDEILTSSTGGKVDFSPGIKDVFATAPAEYLSRVALGLIGRNTDGDLVTADADSFKGQDTIRSANAKVDAVIGLGSTAVGFRSSAEGDFGTAFGFNSIANGKDSTALGTSSVANTNNAVALGERSATSRDNEVSIGNSNPAMTQTRLLANVSDPLLPTDSSNKRYTDEGDKVSPEANNALIRPESGYLVPNSNLKWDNETKIISFSDNKGNSKDIDLSQFVSDIHVDNADFDPETSILTLYMKDEDGTELPPIKIDLGELAKTKLEQSPTVQLSGNGTGVTPLRADVKVSDEAGNSLEARSSGLYVDVPQGGMGLVARDSSGNLAVSDGSEFTGFGIVRSANTSRLAAIGNYSTAQGGVSEAAGNYSTSYGFGAKATADDTVAIGAGSEASHRRSVALGVNSATSRQNEVSIGGREPSPSRFLANVRDPELPQDAATKAYVDSQTIGVGQTWQNVTASRAPNTLYTNNTGRTIVASILIKCTGAIGNSSAIQVDGEQIYFSPMYIATNSSAMVSGVPIPPGAQYRIVNGGASSINRIEFWQELR